MSNSTQVKQVLSSLAAYADILNPSIFKHYTSVLATTIWTEGGEWPKYDEKYLNTKLMRIEPHELRRDFYAAAHVDSATQYVNDTLETYNSCAIAMPCGAGKSTKLVKRLHQLKLGVRTIVVQPSIVVAAELAKYMNESAITVDTQIQPCNNQVRTIHYINAGVFIDACLRSVIDEDDLLVIDEAHTATFMYYIVLELLRRLPNKVVLMTASVTDVIPKRRHVRLHSVQSVTPELSSMIATDIPYIIVGVSDNLTYATPANAITGITCPELQLVYDTGLRPEPRVKDNLLILGERSATVCEIVQTVGRLGRTETDGDAFYCLNAIAMRKRKGIPLYDVLLSSILIAIGLKEGDRQRAVAIWNNSGLLDATEHSTVAVTETDVDDKNEKSYHEQDTIETLPVRDGSSYSPNTTKVVSRYSARTDSASRSLYNAVALRCTTAISDSLDESALQTYWQTVANMVRQGSLLHVSTIPFVNEQLTDAMFEADCRYILAQRMLPSFERREIACIITLWNKYIISLGNKPADMRRVIMFVKYFEELYHFNMN